MTGYQLLPALSPDDYQRLRASIILRGVLVPIEVDEHGVILDGHHRLQIAEELGVNCPTTVRRGLAEHEKRLHAVALNVDRRQLTGAQRVLLGRVIEPDIAEAHRLASLANLKRGKAIPDSDTCHDRDGRSVDEVARLVGLGSGRTYERGARLIEKAETVAPATVEKARAGDIDMRDVAREVRQSQKTERVAQIAAAPVADIPAEQTFPVLYVDPPWRYDGAETPDARKIENHYPTMGADELADIDVPAADDAILFCWATSPKLREAFDLLDAWGFDYRTCLVWVKDRIGMGYYARQQHELLLVAKRGNLPVPEPADRPSSVIHAARGEHSAKPDVVYELIERMYPAFRYCELFARTTRAGWTSWGNQIGEVA